METEVLLNIDGTPEEQRWARQKAITLIVAFERWRSHTGKTSSLEPGEHAELVDRITAELVDVRRTYQGIGLQVFCSRCNLRLGAPGAVLLSPPDENGFCVKAHICVNCYTKDGGML